MQLNLTPFMFLLNQIQNLIEIPLIGIGISGNASLTSVKVYPLHSASKERRQKRFHTSWLIITGKILNRVESAQKSHAHICVEPSHA